MKVVSFNCTGYKSSQEYIAEHLCVSNDIVALQETWLLPHELGLVESLHPDMRAFATSAVDVGRGLVRGRPYGGMAWLWASHLDKYIKPVTFDHPRLLGLRYDDGICSIMFINVYMPTQSNDNFDEYMFLLGKLVSIAESITEESICIIGYFNCGSPSRFYTELQSMCAEKGMTIADVASLPEDTYTFLSDAHGTKSWLDHVCVSDNILRSVQEMKVSAGDATSNHFPLSFSIITEQNQMRTAENRNVNHENGKWEFNNGPKTQDHHAK